MINFDLIKKYDVNLPQYTSYPPENQWQNGIKNIDDWKLSVRKAISLNNAISLYVHLPYCEQICSICNCSKTISTNHEVELPYIQSILEEWKLYIDILKIRPQIKELHLGGGTPAFFSTKNLSFLVEGIMAMADPAPDYEFSFEAHPHYTSFEHLSTLYNLGFRRVSIGVQDFSDDIIHAINRKQSKEDVYRVTQDARSIGYTSINFDIIYGLPFQNAINIMESINKIGNLKPERITFYSYSYIKEKFNGHRAYSDEDIPEGHLKWSLYELGKIMLEDFDYKDIGMGHFALETDSLYQAYANGILHKNFMGYTPKNTKTVIALGASAISETYDAFIRNESEIERYTKLLQNDELPIAKSCFLNLDEKIIRQHILNLMCRNHTSLQSDDIITEIIIRNRDKIDQFEVDGLIVLSKEKLYVTEKGKYFMQNIISMIVPELSLKQTTQAGY